VNESRVVIITGAAVGLGRAMAIGLLGAGHRVVVTGRNSESLGAFATEATALDFQERFLTLRGDVANAEQCRLVVETTIERFEGVDALINNAGGHMPNTRVAPKFYEVREEQWRTIFDTNATGAFLMACAVAPHLIERGWGRIVNHQTNYTSMVRASMNPYGASKAALEASTTAWAEDLAGTGVTVNEILPGGASDVPRLTPEFFPDRSALVSPSVLVEPIRWLLSDASNGITGYRITGNRWNPQATPEVNLRNAAELTGWRGPAPGNVR
jgi:NAD(P)-dependent dehydrogenase (short-subunit alcohol dehydrogenase family)